MYLLIILFIFVEFDIYYIMRKIPSINNFLRQKSFLRKRRRYNRIHKRMRYLRSCKKRIKNSLGNSNERKFNQTRIVRLSAPTNFNLISNPNGVISYINELNEKVRNEQYRCSVFFDLEDIYHIDNGSIGLLLNMVNHLSCRDVKTFGNMPKNEEARKIFKSSGFFEYVNMIQGDKAPTIDRFIVQTGSSNIDNGLIGAEIRKITKHLTGQEEAYQPLYSLVSEMIFNSIEHANSRIKDKNWFFSIHYEESKVVLMVADVGKGILSTLRKKLSQKMNDALHFVSDIKTLVNLFNKKYQSSTFDENRNKGLPKIKECFENNYISNLCVITNNVYLDFNNVNTKELKNNFKGTFYFFELTKENIATWKQRKIS